MLEDAPFAELIDEDPGLIERRSRYAGESAATRRRAAEWVYYQSIANEALARWTGTGEPTMAHGNLEYPRKIRAGQREVEVQKSKGLKVGAPRGAVCVSPPSQA